MHGILNGKKVIFFDIGNTLDRPASGDWMFTGLFYELAGETLRRRGAEEIAAAREEGLRYLAGAHLLRGEDEERERFVRYYGILSERLALGLTETEIARLSEDRARNMANYLLYPDTEEVLDRLSRSFCLGLISDTWPSIGRQLAALGIDRYFSFHTYSFELGVFKPDVRMFTDALGKCGCPAEETVFIDDLYKNLEGAARVGITPVLIAADREPEGKVPCTVIRSLSELL